MLCVVEQLYYLCNTSYAWAGAEILRCIVLLSNFSIECATRQLVPTRGPVLFLTRVAAVPGVLTLRANFEVLQKAHNLAPFVLAILSTHQGCSAE